MGKWNDVEASSAGLFVKLKAGENVVRLMSEPEVFWKSWDAKSKTGKTYKTEKDAKADKKASKKFGAWVIDRTDGAIRILEMGATIVGKIKALSLSKHYAFDTLPGYDIIINKTGSDLLTKYDVVPAPPSPVTDEENEALLDKIEEKGELFEILTKDAEVSIDEAFG